MPGPKSRPAVSYHEIIRWAVGRGYRYDGELGAIIGLSGRQLVVKCCGNQRYPTFSVNYCGRIFGIPAHKFAAFCLWGDESFETGKCVRHVVNNTNDFSAKNLKLGTNQENSLDKSPETRSRAARIARASQGPGPPNKILTREQEEAVWELSIRLGVSTNEPLPRGLGIRISNDLEIPLGLVYACIKRGKLHGKI